MIDYIIVGSGLAGIAFAEQARLNGKSFVVLDGKLASASLVAGGIYNPIVLKRLKLVSGARGLLPAMHLFFDEVALLFGSEFRHPIPTLRRFSSVEEQNDWFTACDIIPDFLVPKIVRINDSNVIAPFGFGEVLETGYVDTAKFINSYRDYLDRQNLISFQTFDFNAIRFSEESILYQDIEARHIIFAEGMGLTVNPYFNYLPIVGTKGELLIVRAELNLDFILKGNVFVMPLGNDLYKVGSTYNWQDKSESPSIAGKEELISAFKELTNCSFEVVDHLAGIRPTVKDRKPLVGTHPDIGRMHILNGLGSRGVMLAPEMARLLYSSIEAGSKIPNDVNISRYCSLKNSDQN